MAYESPPVALAQYASWVAEALAAHPDALVSRNWVGNLAIQTSEGEYLGYLAWDGLDLMDDEGD